MATSALPPDLFDQQTIVSLLSTVAILAVAYGVSRKALEPATPGPLRFLFIWHAFDALIHFCLEGSFLYHCFFSSVPASSIEAKGAYPNPYNFLGYTDRVHGAQAGGDNPFAQLWMVYARADRRWAGVDLVKENFVFVLVDACVTDRATPQGVVSLELLTVFVVGPLACLVCYDIAKKNPRANVVMIILATAELYGGMYSPPPLAPSVGRSWVDTACRLHDVLPGVARRERQLGY